MLEDRVKKIRYKDLDMMNMLPTCGNLSRIFQKGEDN
jgi:hypothetical protein